MTPRLFLLVFLCIVTGCTPSAAQSDSVPAPPIPRTESAAVGVLLEQQNRAESVMKAFAAAYPDILGPAQYINDDWAVSIRGVLYFYAEGRLLPAEELGNIDKYAPHPFYQYSADLPEWRAPTTEESERMKNTVERRNSTPIQRSPLFWDALYRAHDKEESYSRLKTLYFLGHKVMVHYLILEELTLVEEQIMAAAQTNSQVQKWIDSINLLSAWNWRNIAQTQSRSTHAYGTAIDILPASYQGLATYWLWTADTISEWWAIPYTKRLHPPDAVIKAFERYGFIWGGKWTLFDTMHFEYRPELFVLGAIPVAAFH
jgi:hypothetical protein